MTLLSKEQIQNLQKLYLEKKYSQLDFEIESISNFNNRSAFLANLLGISKLRNKLSKEKDFIYSKNLFLDAYTKDPNFIDALCNYALVSTKLKNFSHAREELIKKRNIGYNKKINETLAQIYYFEGNVDLQIQLLKEIDNNNQLNIKNASLLLFSMNYSSNYDHTDYLYYSKKIDKIFSIPINEIKKLKQISLDDGLKVGFVSPDFREHSVYFFLKSVLKSLKKDNIKIIAFNLANKDHLDHVSEELKKEFDEWVDLSELPDFDSADLIIKKKINILFDLAGHTFNNRFRIFKYKPAPIQISWLGYINTTGIKEIDYVIVDKHLIKNGEENLYTEKVLRLPKIWNCHFGLSDKISINDPPMKKNGFITFGCFNHLNKISDKCFDVWVKILKEIHNSKLILKLSSKDTEMIRLKLINKFQQANINESRFSFEGYKTKREDHLKMYNLIDISLDTFPYPGVTTSFESIWMGVPVLTMKGYNFLSRCGESINMNLDLEDFIASNEDDYIKKSILISKDYQKIYNLRKSLRTKALKSALFDQNSFGDDFSKLILNLYKSHGLKKN